MSASVKQHHRMTIKKYSRYVKTHMSTVRRLKVSFIKLRFKPSKTVPFISHYSAVFLRKNNITDLPEIKTNKARSWVLTGIELSRAQDIIMKCIRVQDYWEFPCSCIECRRLVISKPCTELSKSRLAWLCKLVMVSKRMTESQLAMKHFTVSSTEWKAIYSMKH